MDNCLDHISRSSYLRLSRSLIKSNNPDSVSILLNFCPTPSPNGGFNLEGRYQEAIICVGLYAIESELTESIDRVLPYLLNVTKKLYKSFKPDLLSPSKRNLLPSMENFSFCLVSILSEIAYIDGDHQEKIINTIVTSIQKLTETLEDIVHSSSEKYGNLVNLIKTNVKKESNEFTHNQSTFTASERICLFLAPTLLGMLRSLGRVRSNEMVDTPSGIVSSLYPHVNTERYQYRIKTNFDDSNSRHSQCFPYLAFAEAKKIYPDFRSIISPSILNSVLIPNCIENTNNYCLNCSESKDPMDKNTSNTLLSCKEIACDTWFEMNGKECLLKDICSTFGSRLVQRLVFSHDLHTFHATDIGKENSLSDVFILVFQPQTLKNIMKTVSILLNDRFARRLDTIAYTFWLNRPKNIGYPYRSWSHCLRLGSISLVRDILYNPDQEIPNKILSSFQMSFWDTYTDQETYLQTINDLVDRTSDNESKFTQAIFNNPEEYIDDEKVDELDTPNDLQSDVNYAQNVAQNLKQKIAQTSRNVRKQLTTINLQAEDTSGIFIPKDINSQKFAYQMISDISATCLQIIAKSIHKNNDAESFIGKLQERIKAGMDFSRSNFESSKTSFYGKKLILSSGSLMNYFDCALTLTKRFNHLVKELLEINEKFLLKKNSTLNGLYSYIMRIDFQLESNQSPENENKKLSYNETMHLLDKRKKVVSVMDRTRESAMFALCHILNNHPKYIESTLNNISKEIFYLTQNFKDSQLLYHNAILTMGFIGLQLNRHENVQKTVINIFNQNLQNFPEMRNEIFDILALMSISKSDCYEIFDRLLDLYHSMNKRKSKEFNSKNNTLANLVVCIQGTHRLQIFLEKILVYISENIDINLNDPYDKELITIVAIIVKRLSPSTKFNEKCEKLFRDFWLLMTISMFKSNMSITDLHNDIEVALGIIATRTPPILFRDSINSELTNNSIYRSSNLSPPAIRQRLTNMIGSGQYLIRQITNMLPHVCVYMMVIYNVETLCSLYATSPESFGRIFNYIEDANLMKDKLGCWEYLFAMSRNLLGYYVDRLSKTPLSDNQVVNVELFAQHLLVKFCHPHEKVNFVADDVLCSLHKAFSYISWSGKIIRSMLDINQILSLSIQKDVLDSNSTSYPLPNTPYTIILAKSMDERINISNKFLGRCTSLLDIGLEIAPDLVRSHLADYILRQERNWTSLHGEFSGLQLATNKLLKNVNQEKLSSSIPMEKTESSPSNFMSNLNLRCLYLGEITGMLSMMNSQNEVVKKLVSEFESNCNNAKSISESINKLSSGEAAYLRESEMQRYRRKLQSDLKATLMKIYTCIYRITALLVMPQFDNSRQDGPLGEDDSDNKTINYQFDDKLNVSGSISSTKDRFCECNKKFSRDSHTENFSYAINGQLVREMVQVVCTAPLKLFTPEMMETCIACWLWIIAGRQSLMVYFIRELSLSWLLSIKKKLGVFSPDKVTVEELSPLNIYEHGESPEMTIDNANPVPHKMWAKFFMEILKISQYTCEEQVNVLVNMLQKTLVGEDTRSDKYFFKETESFKSNQSSLKKIEWGVGTLSRQIPALEVRLLLIEMCLSVVQHAEKGLQDTDQSANHSPNSSLSGTPPSKLAQPRPSHKGHNLHTIPLSLEIRMSLRYKAYFALLNFFSVEPKYYSVDAPYFKTNLHAAMNLFERFRSESKYLENLTSADDQTSLASSKSFTKTLLPANHHVTSHNISRSFSGNNIGEKQTNLHNNTKTLPSDNSFHHANESTQLLRGNSCYTNDLSALHAINNNQSTLLNSYQMPKELDASPNDLEYEKSLFRKIRDLILLLLATEIERLVIWINPMSRPQLPFSEPTAAEIWLKKKVAKDKSLRGIVELTWNIAPSVAIFLPDRLRNEKLNDFISEMMMTNPCKVSHLPSALKFLATPSNIQSEIPELIHTLTWSHVPVLTALSFFSRVYPRHPLTHQYSIRVLEAASPDTLIFYVPQIVQGLRHDSLGYLIEFILECAHRSPLFCHQLLWNMKTNVYRDEDCKIKDPEIGSQLENIMNQIRSRFTGPLNELYEREFTFFDEITNISAIIKPYPKGPEREKACLEALEKVNLKKGCYLPSNPDAIVLEIDRKSGRPMQSAEKAPFLARFKVQRCGVKRLEEFALKGAEPIEDVVYDSPSSAGREEVQESKVNRFINFGRKSANVQDEAQQNTASESLVNKRRPSFTNISLSQSPNNPRPTVATNSPASQTKKLLKIKRRHGEEKVPSQNATSERDKQSERNSRLSTGNQFPSGPITQQACIFKVGDDVRQDILALQVIQLFKNIFEQSGIEHFLYPYRVVATAPGCGVIECVPDSQSRDQIGRHTKIQLPEYFISKFGPEKSLPYIRARKNFIISMAAYSVVCYILQVKDRHNGNIMLDKHGHIIHIDFGFIFEISPGGNIGFEPHIKLSKEMLDIMGRNTDSPVFRWFETLTIQAYLAIRPYKEAIVALVSLMLDTNLPCFRGQTIKQLKARFCPNMNDREAAADFQKKLNDCVMNWRGTGYDIIQHYQNQIAM